ncbi:MULTISPECIES: type II toxin-antitoxin system RelE/ParE family toxin [unclassified Pannonibacter]|jgi:plasmid stabilization system protein ParE|uniref:type II toxin-antitoxin system RelE/ParE family toxin n=1 Tax=unclassified Pannonibacter TaxID=2627228 RepID=UPI001644FFF4|nr:MULTISPECIES: type II toxin-antitoxin system RelE/ParE family toxin [unclassified Pannonibacter]
MIPIRLSKDAADYVRKETDYLRQRNPAAARNFSQAIKNAKRMLQSFPESGNKTHGLQIAGNRVLVAGDYLIEYSYDGSEIDVTTIRHGRMLMPTPDVDVDNDLNDDIDPAPGDTKP